MHDARSFSYWADQAQSISFPSQAFIDGAYVDAIDGHTFETVSPIDGRVLGAVAACNEKDVNRAVAAARAAVNDGRWAGLAPGVRKAILLRFKDLILAHKEELALLETLDMGKPISDAQNVDVAATARSFQWYGEAIDKMYDEIAPTAQNTIATITREPIGVCAVVVPWNFPMIMASWKVAPALAAGNSVVLKPAEQSPLTALRLAALASEAGIPDGVFNVVPGFGPDVGQPLGLHMDVDGVYFTGSTQVGKLFQQYSGQSNLKRVSVECGGKSGHIILDDCSRLDDAATAAAYGIFFNQGEMCSAGSRLIVHKAVYQAVMDKILDIAAKMQPDNPLNPESPIGAMVGEEHTQQVEKYLEIGKTEATVAAGGARVHPVAGGCYIPPTVFTDVPVDARIAQEEIFGPVLCVTQIESAEEAVQVANNSIYGLAAGVWSDNVNTLHACTKALKAGVVYANCYDADDITVPFGGYKQSGIGRDKSLHAFDKYTEMKTTWLRLYS